jgi:hypothetical protein
MVEGPQRNDRRRDEKAVQESQLREDKRYDGEAKRAENVE